MAKSNSSYLNKMHRSDKTGYRFQDKDPVVDLLREAIQFATSKEGGNMSLDQIAADAMCTWQTIVRIDTGKTRRPLNTTCDRIFAACGFSRPLIRMTLDAAGGELSPEQMMALLQKIVSTDMTKAQIIAMITKALKLKPKPVK